MRHASYHHFAMPLALALTLVGAARGHASDWPMFGHDPQHTGVATDILNPGQLVLDKTYAVPGGAQINSSPSVVAGRVYFGAENGTFYCLEANQLTLLWQYPTTGVIRSTAALDGGRAYFVSGDNLQNPGLNDHRLYCLDAGINAPVNRLIWNYQLGTTWGSVTAAGGWVDSSPTTVNGRVYVGSRDGYAYCFDADLDGVDDGPIVNDPNATPTSGDLMWKTKLVDLQGGISAYVVSTPAYGTVGGVGYVYLGAFDGAVGKIFCLNATTGTIEWSDTIPGFPSGNNDHRVLSSVTFGVVDGDPRVFLGSCNYFVHCYHALPPRFQPAYIWSHRVWGSVNGDACEVRGTPALVNNRLLLPSGKGIVCLDVTGDNPNTNRYLWGSGTQEEEVWSSPALSYSHLFYFKKVGPPTGTYIRARNVNTGAVEATWNQNWNEQNSSPTIANGRLYVTHRLGTLMSYK